MPDYDPVEDAKLRDERYRVLELGIEIEAELRKGRPLAVLMEALRRDADEAMAAFAEANPGDTKEIMGLQARVFCFRYALRAFDMMLKRGELAEQSLRGQDPEQGDE